MLTYGSAESIADRLSRVDRLKEDSMGTPVDLTAYTYSGVGRLATADYLPIDVKLDLYQGATNGTYAGFDRFGRVKEHLWDDYDTGSPPNIAQVKYGYNEVGSRTWREDVMAAANSENHDEFYTHDGLHRLKTFDRGDLTGSPYSGINGTPSREEDYVLQQLGNWQSYTIKENGSTLLSQARSHNTANEIHSILTTSWTDPEHDAAGNMTRMPQPKNPAMAGGYTAVYDAWNRLISLSDSNGTVQTNEYDGLHRRIIRDETGGAGVLTHFYYNENWQCLEERTGSSGNAGRQYVWHPYYIDALAVSYDLAGSKTFYTHDANFNVTAAINASGTVVERYQYTPYGEATILDDDFGPDGDNVSDIGNEFLYTGRRLDPETGIYYYRLRYYHAQLGRFVTRDPIGYWGGMNLYGYVGGMPTFYVDPVGLVGAAHNHWYPLYLGGASTGPTHWLDEVHHQAFHNYFADHGLGWRGKPGPGGISQGDLARQKWASFTPGQRRLHLINAMLAAGKDAEYIANQIENVMAAEVWPGIRQIRGGAPVLPKGQKTWSGGKAPGVAKKCNPGSAASGIGKKALGLGLGVVLDFILTDNVAGAPAPHIPKKKCILIKECRDHSLLQQNVAGYQLLHVLDTSELEDTEAIVIEGYDCQEEADQRNKFWGGCRPYIVQGSIVNFGGGLTTGTLRQCRWKPLE